MTDIISDARLAEIRAGLEGVTPGPWILGKWDATGGYDCMYGGLRAGPIVLDGGDYGQRACKPISKEGRANIEADAAHIARLDPQTVLALLSRLDKAEGRDRTQATFEVYQDGAPVAMASGPRERAYAEAMHYVAVYGQDGLPIELYEHVPVALPPPPSES